MRRAAITVTQITNEDEGFYAILGPYFGSRAVHRELGGPLFDDPEKVWWIARRGRRLVGFWALTEDGGYSVLKSAYVLPEERGERVYDALFQARLAHAVDLGLPMRAVVTPGALGTFKRHGFRVDPAGRAMKKYVTMVRD
jgi:GNAT superfamily N-acetyltransferase